VVLVVAITSVLTINNLLLFLKETIIYLSFVFFNIMFQKRTANYGNFKLLYVAVGPVKIR
jgi:uncharacterized membrane protein